jgi:hypothetical protein
MNSKRLFYQEKFDGHSTVTFEKNQMVPLESELTLTMRLMWTKASPRNHVSIFKINNNMRKDNLCAVLKEGKIVGTIHTLPFDKFHKGEANEMEIKMDQWYNLAFVLNQNTFSIFINGILENEYSGSVIKFDNWKM